MTCGERRSYDVVTIPADLLGHRQPTPHNGIDELISPSYAGWRGRLGGPRDLVPVLVWGSCRWQISMQAGAVEGESTWCAGQQAKGRLGDERRIDRARCGERTGCHRAPGCVSAYRSEYRGMYGQTGSSQLSGKCDRNVTHPEQMSAAI